MAMPMRTSESIRKSKTVEIHMWMERGLCRGMVEGRSSEDQCVGVRWVGDPSNEKSRYVICGCATPKDPMAFAAASDHRWPRLAQLKAIKLHSCSM